MTIGQALTLEQFLSLPEQKPALEYAGGGEITQKPIGPTDHSSVQFIVAEWLQATRQGRAYPELRIILGGAARVPDVAFYRQHRLPREQRPTTPPDVVVEVLSPDQGPADLAAKCRWYVEQGVEVAVVADPESRILTAFTPIGEQSVHGSESLSVLGVSLTADDVFVDLLGD